MPRFFSVLDLFLIKVRRNGFLLYTAIVVAATLYTFYSISNIPNVNELKDLQEKQKKRRRLLEEEKKKKDAASAAAAKEKRTKDPGLVENWSRRQLFTYLSNNKVFPDIESSMDELVAVAKKIQHENSLGHFI